MYVHFETGQDNDELSKCLVRCRLYPVINITITKDR